MTVAMILGLALAAGAPEPVVWTKMVDPDPDYVAPKAAKPRPTAAKVKAKRSGDPDNLESAVVNLMEEARQTDDAIMRDYERQVRALEERAERARADPIRPRNPAAALILAAGRAGPSSLPPPCSGETHGAAT